MTWNNDWFIKLDYSVRRVIKFTNNSKVTYQGTRNILMKENDVQ